MIIISLSFFMLIYLIILKLNEFITEIKNIKVKQEEIEIKVNNNIEQIKLMICNINLTPMET